MTMSVALSSGDQTMVRRANELSLLEIMRSREPLTLRELASETGLSWRTTSVIAESLVEAGWLVEMDADGASQRRGRPAKRYERRAEAGHVLGVDIGWENIRSVVADLDGVVVGSATVRVSVGEVASERIADVGHAALAALANAHLTADEVWAATVATSGVVGRDGVVTKSVLFEGWDRINPGTRLAHELGCPVTVLNDSTLAARAEQWQGHQSDDLIYLLAEARLGTGMIIGGQLHRGFAGAAGEIGEISELGWNTAAEKLIAGVEADNTDDAAAHVFEAARRGEAESLAAVDAYAETLARGLAAMVLTIDPEMIVVGGAFAAAADLLLPRFATLLKRTCIHPPRLVASQLGDAAVGLGAIRVALDTVEAASTQLDTATPFTPSDVKAQLRQSAGPEGLSNVDRAKPGSRLKGEWR